jgi:hypothetical protein
MRQMAELPGDVRSVARQRVKGLSDNPRSSRAKELDGHPGYYRLWLPRNCRQVYQLIDDELV